MSLKTKLLGIAFALGVSATMANAQVVVSSKIDTEGGVLGNIILAMLKANNIQTTDRIQLGATPVVRKDVADANKLKTLTDFGKYVAGGGKIVLAASSEFVNSAAALPAFQTTYGFKLKPDQLITLSGGDTAATIAAAANQTNNANAAMVYGTDGGIAPSGLVVLEDDKGVQPVYQPTPIIREAVLKKNPNIEAVLKPVFAKLDLVTLQDLNGRVQVGGEPAKAVAEDFLKKNGFLK